MGRNASWRNNCSQLSLGTQLKEFQMVCDLSTFTPPPMKKGRGGGVTGGRVCLTWEVILGGGVGGPTHT